MRVASELTIETFPPALADALDREVGLIPTTEDSEGNLVWGSRTDAPLKLNSLICVPRLELEGSVGPVGFRRSRIYLDEGTHLASVMLEHARAKLAPRGEALPAARLKCERDKAKREGLLFEGNPHERMRRFAVAAVCSFMLREPIDASICLQDAARACFGTATSGNIDRLVAAASLAELGAFAAASRGNTEIQHHCHRLAAFYWLAAFNTVCSSNDDSKAFSNRSLLNALAGEAWCQAADILSLDNSLDNRLRLAWYLVHDGIISPETLRRVHQLLHIEFAFGGNEDLLLNRRQVFEPFSKAAFDLMPKVKLPQDPWRIPSTLS